MEPEDYSSDGESGSGVEFVIETDRQGDWAIVHLRRMLTLELLLGSGRIGKGPLGLHDRIPLKEPIDGVEGHLVRNLMTVSSDLPEFVLPSGKVIFVQLIGLTDAEREFANSGKVEDLLQRLAVAEAIPVIRPDRPSVV